MSGSCCRWPEKTAKSEDKPCAISISIAVVMNVAVQLLTVSFIKELHLYVGDWQTAASWHVASFI